MIRVGIVGKPNVGKSTFFAAATLAPAEIASYPFTTIKPNRGVAYIRSPCPCRSLGVTCTPKNSLCIEGERFVPLELVDLAGLVPGAHKGRGLGNQFLDDIRQASVLIHIIDASGGTDEEGRQCSVEGHDPLEDVRFLEDELSHWLADILTRDWAHLLRLSQMGKSWRGLLAERLAGLGITEPQLSEAIAATGVPQRPQEWRDEDMLALARGLRNASKPMVLAANKCDIAPPQLLKKVGGVPTCAEAELALRRAADAELIAYRPGDASFRVLCDQLPEAQAKALHYIEKLLGQFHSTGVQECIERARHLLDLIVVYPVENEHRYTDKEGNVLPDAYLIPRGSSARDLAYMVHTDLGEGFIRAIDARTKRVIGADQPLEEGSVVKIVA